MEGFFHHPKTSVLIKVVKWVGCEVCHYFMLHKNSDGWRLDFMSECQIWLLFTIFQFYRFLFLSRKFFDCHKSFCSSCSTTIFFYFAFANLLSALGPCNFFYEFNSDDQRKPSSFDVCQNILPMNFRMMKLVFASPPDAVFSFLSYLVKVYNGIHFNRAVKTLFVKDWKWQLRDYVFIFNHHQHRIWWVCVYARLVKWLSA